MKRFFKEVTHTFLPGEWDELSRKPVKQGLLFFSKILLAVFALLLVLHVPKLVQMPVVIGDQLGRFEELKCEKAVVEMSAPIRLPRFDPAIVIDTTGQHEKVTTERLLVTKDKVFFRPLFKSYQVDVEELKNIGKNKEQVSVFFAALVFFVIPSIVFYAYVALWLKYLIIMFLLSIIIFILLDLTHWKRKWKHVFVTACHASFIPLLIEVVFSVWNAELLLPVFSLAGIIKIYAVPVAAFFVLTILALLLAYYHPKE